MTTTIALAGKGGTGKTTFAAMLIKHLVETNAGTVLAIDADPSANLNLALGMKLDQTIGDEGDSQLGDFIEDSEAVVAVDAVSFTLLQDQLQSVLETLSEREAGVVRLRFGLTDGQPRTLDEIGQVYGVTRERIRQIESKTMSKLRHPSRSQVLRDYLD